MPQLVPLIDTRITERTKVLHDKGHDIPATTTVMTEVRLAGFVLRMPDDNRVSMIPPVIQKSHLDILSHTSLAVDAITQRIGNVIDANLFL